MRKILVFISVLVIVVGAQAKTVTYKCDSADEDIDVFFEGEVVFTGGTGGQMRFHLHGGDVQDFMRGVYQEYLDDQKVYINPGSENIHFNLRLPEVSRYDTFKFRLPGSEISETATIVRDTMVVSQPGIKFNVETIELDCDVQ